MASNKRVSSAFVIPKLITQNYITGCPKFCLKTEIGLKMNVVFYSVEMSSIDICITCYKL
ncbi:hypothetical protein BV917_12595 [Leptospira santarosai serovar Guaricura]|nr:hypothetical protein BV917_12595 [Leptospira santarosai serovar Guaricura]